MSRYHDLTRIIPDLHDIEFDEAARREEHYAIFGHMPPEGAKCNHPVHDAVRREMNGAYIEVDFDPNGVISSDSELERQRQARYDSIYQATRQFQKEVEQEEKMESARRAGLILPGRVY